MSSGAEGFPPRGTLSIVIPTGALQPKDAAEESEALRYRRGAIVRPTPQAPRPPRDAMDRYYVYIMTNAKRTLYVGVTHDLQKRVWEHKEKVVDGFTSRYKIGWLIYYEATSDVIAALEREKQLKRWRREKKVALIESFNHEWADLAQGWNRNDGPAPQTPRLRPSAEGLHSG